MPAPARWAMPWCARSSPAARRLKPASHLDDPVEQRLAAADQERVVGVLERRVADAAMAWHEQHSSRDTCRHRARVVARAAAHPLPGTPRALAHTDQRVDDAGAMA